jgi:glycosyl transferase, family 25
VSLPVFLINLDRSPERLASVTASLPDEGLRLVRVAGVDGKSVPPADWSSADEARFRRCHGRRMLAGEYGCYQSHLKALDAVIAASVPLALIAEDDIELNDDLAERVAAIVYDLPQLDALKLVSHRTQGFVRHGASRLGDLYGRCLHGPQGSAACYAVTAGGAARLRRALATMWLPFDVALERGWATGAAIYSTRDNLVGFSDHRAASFINADADSRYAKTKPPAYKRLPTAAFRASDYARRIIYALDRHKPHSRGI